MVQNRRLTNLEQLLDRIDEAGRNRKDVSVGDLLEEVGERSFGPFLLVAGLVVLSPIIGDIPGMPTATGVFVLLIATQLLFGRKHFWLPRWMLRRSVSTARLRKVTRKWMRPPARFVDRLVRPRLLPLVRPTRVYALVCVAIALSMPAMEVIPFSANIAGGAFTAFGLALIARDGLLALIAFVLTAGMLGIVINGLL